MTAGSVQVIIVYNNNITFPAERGQFSRRSFYTQLFSFQFSIPCLTRDGPWAPGDLMSQVYGFITHITVP